MHRKPLLIIPDYLYFIIISPLLKDSSGGIVEFDTQTLKEIRRWLVEANSITFSHTKDSILFLNTKGLHCIDLLETNPSPKRMIKNHNEKEIWYALSLSPDGQQLLDS